MLPGGGELYRCTFTISILLYLSTGNLQYDECRFLKPWQGIVHFELNLIHLNESIYLPYIRHLIEWILKNNMSKLLLLIQMKEIRNEIINAIKLMYLTLCFMFPRFSWEPEVFYSIKS